MNIYRKFLVKYIKYKYLLFTYHLAKINQGTQNKKVIEKSARIHLEIVYFYVRAMLSVSGILIIDIRKEQQDGKENAEKCKLKILDNQEEKS